MAKKKPHAGWFKKGYDPRRYNKGAVTCEPAKEIRQLLKEKKKLDGKDITAMQAIIMRAIRDAVAGDDRARLWLFDRGFGKAKDIIELLDKKENPLANELRNLREMIKEMVEEEGGNDDTQN